MHRVAALGVWLSSLAFVTTVFAQTPPVPLAPAGAAVTATAVTLVAAPIFLEPNATRQPLRVAKEGSVLRLLEDSGEWCQVEFQDPQFGRRVGYIQSKFVRISDPKLDPVDVSIQRDSATSPPTRQPSAVAVPGRPAQPIQPRQTAQTPNISPRLVDRGWIDVDVARLESRQDAQTLTRTFPLFREAAGLGAGYPDLPAFVALGVSGGVAIGSSGFGISVRFGAEHYTHNVALAIVVPSQFFFGNSDSDATFTSSQLERKDRSVDISAQYTFPTNRRFRIRAFGGPTYFHVTNEMVSDIGFSQFDSPILPVNVVVIKTFAQSKVSGSGGGFNVGGDASVFFAEHVGAGGGVRFNAGKVNVNDPLTQTKVELRAGHLEVGGGLRLRF